MHFIEGHKRSLGFSRIATVTPCGRARRVASFILLFLDDISQDIRARLCTKMGKSEA
jgi:hypothetical protein